MTTIALNIDDARSDLPGATLTRSAGPSGRMLVAATVSGGILLGGFHVGILGLLGRTNGNALLITAAVLYVAGSILGALVGAGLGLAGREAGADLRTAGRQLGIGALYAIPASAVGFIVAGWIALAAAAAWIGTALPVVGSAGAALVGAAIVLASLGAAAPCAANAWRRVAARLAR